MKTRIAKDFRWEMGHRLPFHSGGCQNLHGHSYRLRVEIIGEVNEYGMVIDYFDLKTIVQPLVDTLDHAFIYSEDDRVMHKFFDANPMKTIVVPFSTTAENIAAYILNYLSDVFSSKNDDRRISALIVRLYETETTFAELQMEF